MDSEVFLTGGASRALDLAASLAGRQQADSVSPSHLLAALLIEEGVAAEYLNRRGLELNFLRSSDNDIWHASWDSDTSPQISPPHDQQLGEIIIRARSRAHSGGRSTETDTLDLLVGLLEQGGPAADFLNSQGIDADTLPSDAPSERTGSGQPLPMVESIRWQSSTGEDHLSLLRIIDSSSNRLREGIRVIEEYFRFHRDDPHLSAWLKRIRHRFTEASRNLPSAELLTARDTERDVGTSITLPSEMSRESLDDLLWANLKRAQEAARTLEEYGKLVSSLFADAVKQLRYELYTFEKSLGTLLNRGQGWIPHPLYLLVTEDLCLRGSGPVIRGALAAGVRIIQIREKHFSDRKLVEHGRRVREWTREFGATLIMNDRPDIAVLIDADGVHVGQDELSVADARKIVGPKRFVGLSTHSLEQAEQALRDGADYIGVGPVFPSKTKSFDQFVGLDLIRSVCNSIPLPAYAIGGIDADNLPSVLESGARGVAVSSAICSAPDPQSAAADLLRHLPQLTNE